MNAHCPEPTSAHDPAPDRVLTPLLAPLRVPLARIPPLVLPLASLAAATGALGALARGAHLLGGLLIFVSALLDAAGALPTCSQPTARRRIAAAVDRVTDRYADLCILGGLGAWSLAHEDRPAPLVVAFVALAGELALAYAGARVRASAGAVAARERFRRAGRDVRLLLAALGALTGQAWLALVLLAVLTHATVAWGLIRLKQRLQG
jgi:hypothetical protein